MAPFVPASDTVEMTHHRHNETVRVKADLTSLAEVRAALDATLDDSEWPQDDSSRLMLAAGEAVCNAIEHGSVETGQVEVEIDSDDTGLTLVVTDEGRPGAEPHLDLAAGAPPSHSIRGRGLMIMRELADEIAIEPHGEGTRVRMRFERDDVADSGSAHRAA